MSLGGLLAAAVHPQGPGPPRPVKSDSAQVDPARFLGDSGTFVYALMPDESDDVNEAIDHTVAHMNFIVRPIARHRLTRTNHPPPHITFGVRSDTLVVTLERSNPIRTPRNGHAVPWASGVSREMYAASITFVGDTLRQLILASDGQRVDDFVFREGGARVDMHVTLSAERLPTPLVYTLIFRRVP